MEPTKKSEESEDCEIGSKDQKPQSPKTKKELSVVTLPHDNDVSRFGRIGCLLVKNSDAVAPLRFGSKKSSLRH